MTMSFPARRRHARSSRFAIRIQATNVCIATIHFIRGNRNGKVNARSNLIERCETTL
ncbi:hypothetical protein C7S13_8459 [Burkholderia cepacia]|nr:hypothetical protein [Burkholderia cepacia]